MAARPVPKWLMIVVGVGLAAGVIVVFWSWAWLIPLVEARASAAIGRSVSVGALDVDLGRITRVRLEDVTIANPDDYPAPPETPFAHAAGLAVDVDVTAYIRERRVSLPLIAVERPRLLIAATEDGRTTYGFSSGGADDPEDADDGGPPAEIRRLEIRDGHAKVVIPRLRADFDLDIATRHAEGSPQIVIAANGRYAGQPIKGRLIGGAVLALQEEAQPYPIDLDLANGPTRVRMTGTVRDPLDFKGIDVTLRFEGPDMAMLTPLTGVPIPETPPYAVSGKLAYAEGRIRFEDFSGRVGDSDLSGTIAVDPGLERPHVAADLRSESVDLDDLGGFIGARPGDVEAEPDARLLPDTPLNMPKIRAADVTLSYRGAHIKGRNMPFDSISAELTIDDGRITLRPLTLGVGDGEIVADVDLDPVAEDRTRMRADINFRQLSLSRLMNATGTFEGEGLLGGKADLHATGNSLASFLGNGNGEIVLIMTGGDLSALLVSLSGLQLGNAVVAAMGLPERTELRCLVAAMPLEDGVLRTKVMLVDTETDNIYGDGTVDLKAEQLDYEIRTESKKTSVGTVRGPIHITGPFRNPTIRPGAEAAARTGAAAVLGTVLSPLAGLLPTIQFGTAEDTDCGELIRRVTTGAP